MRLRFERYSNLTQRIIAALVGVAVLIGGIIWSEWAYFAIFLFIALMSILEFYKLVGIDGMVPLKFWGSVCTVTIFVITFLIEKQILETRWLFLIFPVVLGTFFIKLYKKNEKKPFTNIAFTLLGIVYIGVPFSMMHFLVYIDDSYNWRLLLAVLFITWASDTGAYFAGSRYGKRALFARVSPKKSWEGSVGGTALALVFALIFDHYLDFLVTWQWLCVTGIVIIAGTYGDLVESLFKRSIAIKDSGTSIPGHGGFLDRFDSLFISLPFVVAFLELIR